MIGAGGIRYVTLNAEMSMTTRNRGRRATIDIAFCGYSKTNLSIVVESAIERQPCHALQG